MITREYLENLENWREVTKGLYRYVLAAKVCYEIHILHHAHDTPIDKAKASLFLVGDWRSDDGGYFQREALLENVSVAECLRGAYKDYRENVIE